MGKKTMNRVNEKKNNVRASVEWEKIFANCISNNGLKYRIYKEFQNLSLPINKRSK